MNAHNGGSVVGKIVRANPTEGCVSHVIYILHDAAVSDKLPIMRSAQSPTIVIRFVMKVESSSS